MNPADRQAEIVNIIRQKNRVEVGELADFLQISRETIRRDLSELVRAGKVQKFHGGASLPMMTGEGPFRDRMSENAPAKAFIANEAAKLIVPGETVLIDTGSTTLYFAEKLAEIPNLTIVTNSAEIAGVISLAPSQSKTFLLGGEFSGDNRQTVGSMAISQVRTFRAHHAVLTIGALDIRTGIMDFCIEEAQVARAMIEQAESLTVLADSTKFGRIASFEVCGLDRVTNLVCDQQPAGKIKSALKEAGVKIIIAGE
ncbi:MAG TPA: DeoR/GlpR transcriptional regulator [Desulfobacterales bacterium]|nr:DeoR/GlpR transcriptional regulator [Desulfobacterales bacterium]HIP40023.1 DeoR/GlpR transcriptional regulator [Desulfocapsa sulfexigens]